MANFHRVSSIALLIAIIGRYPTVVRAEESVSEKYGFRFHVPVGFHELADDTPTVLKMFTEENESAADYLITIQIQGPFEAIDPAQRLDLEKLPKKDGLTLTSETRRWNELELQAIRQDISAGPDMQFVGYIIQFPFEQAIQIRVQGPKSREQEVRKAFDESVRSFVATAHYIVKVEKVQPGKATRTAVLVLMTIVPLWLLVGALIYFNIRKRKRQSQSLG